MDTIDTRQKARIEQALSIKAHMISKQICLATDRQLHPGFTRIIKRHISSDLKHRFAFTRLSALPNEQYSAYLQALREYAYFYCGNWYR